MNGNGASRSVEWQAFEANAEELRKLLGRGLRRELVHDPRAAVARIQNLSVADLADEAFTWALENWKQKPTTTSPELWTRKRAHQLLDEALDSETLAAESRAEERRTERILLAHDIHDDDEERTDWLDMAELAGRSRRPVKDLGEDEPFDGLESDPQVSSPADRLDGRETLVELERAMLGLPENRRKAVAHRYLDGLSVEEIAYLMDSPAVAVEREIATGLVDLQRALAAG